jgi:hypothetical protein
MDTDLRAYGVPSLWVVDEHLSVIAQLEDRFGGICYC